MPTPPQDFAEGLPADDGPHLREARRRKPLPFFQLARVDPQIMSFLSGGITSLKLLV